MPITNVTSNRKENGTIHQLTRPLLRKLQVRILSIYKLSMNIYTIMYRVLYNKMGNTENKDYDIAMMKQ